MSAAATATSVTRCRQTVLCMTAVVLVILAGCSGITPESDDDRDPYSVDDELNFDAENGSAENEAPDYLAPGLTTAGIEDVSTLHDHHFDVLERESGAGTYAVVEYSNTSRNGTLVSENRERTVVAYPTGWRNTFTRITHEDNETRTVVYDEWVTETEWLTRVDSSNDSTRYDRGENSERPEHPLVLNRRMERVLSIVAEDDDNVTVEERTRSGETWYIVTQENKFETDISGVNVRTIRIREDGFIEHVDENRTRETWKDGAEVTEFTQSHITFEIATNETLDRPDWYEEAREATSDTDE